MGFSEKAYFATLTEGYNKDEIARATDGAFLTVNVSMTIVSFLDVDEIDKTLKIVLEMSRTWFDARLTLLHLPKDVGLNYLGKKSYKKIWYPKLVFENIDPSENHIDRRLLYTVSRDSNIPPTIRNPGTTKGRNEFRGSEHKIVRTQEYTYFWRCVYDMKWYPFDRQTCDMWISMPPYYQNVVRMNPERIVYKGKRDELTEYSVDKILFCSRESGSQLVFEVTLGRPLISSILTIYIPTLLLLVIRFQTQPMHFSLCKVTIDSFG